VDFDLGVVTAKTEDGIEADAMMMNVRTKIVFAKFIS
jgi:hypothetical protein